MHKSEWRKTPYAETTAANTEEAIRKLLKKWNVNEHTWTEGPGPSGRPAVMLRFLLKGAWYRFVIEVLDAPGVTVDQRLAQIKRALFYQLKAQLELACCFFSVEQALFAWKELGRAGTVFTVVNAEVQKEIIELGGPVTLKVAGLLSGPVEKP